MTNRRRSGKGRAAVSKKSESPDKQTKKLTRRGRRGRKSESPEQPENAGSECSGEEIEDSHNKGVDGDEESDSCRDSSQFDLNKSNDDQKAQAKEEESGGSDGSWKVKSENGGGGGIPKLKLCLTRPPELPSPTSEQNPSPRRRRRSGRGNATPTKEEQVEENAVVEESSKRVTRNQKIRELQIEVAAEKEPEVEVKEDAKEDFSTTNVVYNAEEDETRLAVESICGTVQNDENQMSVVESIQEETAVPKDIEVEKHPEPTVEENFGAPLEEIPIPSVEKPAEEPVQQKQHVEEVDTVRAEPEPSKTPSPELEETKQEIEKEATVQVETAPSKPEPEPEPEPEAEAEAEPVLEIMERRRSSSRDSSEERAKEAALRSRNKNKRKEGSEEGEVIESPGGEITRRNELQDKSKKSVGSASVERDGKENLEEHAPAKSGARKRRWGSSTSRTNKKPSVSISTDFLKEIIPEAKPLLMSEVQLSPNEEDEEGQLKDSEESLPITKKVEREKMMQSDESEKDYEEEAVESGMEEPSHTEVTKPTIQVKEKEFTTFTRKVSVMSSNERLQKSPSPARNKPSNILYIINLVRPFTIPQLRELLARTGTIVEDGFWIDKIKSKCYVKYESEEQARTTRHALHGVRWPVSNPKQLSVDFGTEAAMKAAMEGNEIPTKRPIPSLFDKPIDLKTSEKAREREKERERERERDRDRSGDRRERTDKDKKDRSKHRAEEEKRDEGEDEKDKKSRPPVEPLVRDRTVRRVTMPIREWDVGKNEDGFSPPPDGIEFSRHRDDRYERRVEYDKDKRDDNDDRRRRDRDRSRRSVSGEPPRKSKKKTEEEAPAKLLDDLFRKTKATPCIYWLPLTPEQIAVKEEMRRKHMAEHEKKVAELKKMQREQNKRGSDKRRRRTRSRSRSRSAKK